MTFKDMEFIIPPQKRTRLKGCCTHVLAEDVVRILNPDIAHPEGYILTLTEKETSIEAHTEAGLFYGQQTLNELIRFYGNTIPCQRIEDAPAFTRRGVYLDCSRGKVPTLETLFDLIEQLAAWKINELQLYVENVFQFSFDPEISHGFSPFTADDILALQSHCTAHHIHFVPSMACFGHFERILSLKKYRGLGEKPGLWGFPGGTTLCPGDRRSIKLVRSMMQEYAPLFLSDEFNICGDETWELGKGRSAKRVEKSGVGPVYLSFIKKLHRLCQEQDKRMNMWADIVLNHPECIPDLPKDIVLLNWDYTPKGQRMKRAVAFKEAGLSWIACPGCHDWGSHGTRLQTALENIGRSTHYAKKYDAQGILVTAWGDYGHRNPLGPALHSMAFAASCSWKGAKPNSSFTERYATQVLGNKKWAPVIRATGAVDDLVGEQIPYYSLTQGAHAYRGIPPRSPLHRPPPHRKDWIGEADLEGCEAVLANQPSPPSIPAKATRFIKNTMEDYRFCLTADRTICKRILALRQGNTPSPAQSRAYIAAFKKTWLLRNRSSRLKDNLTVLNNVLFPDSKKK